MSITEKKEMQEDVKQVQIGERYHRWLKVEAAKRDMTMREFIEEVIHYYGIGKEEELLVRVPPKKTGP